ncbi:hypothetical protein [Acuticoccus sediminis]|uniref:hypothetical protein n=1 Tax=Acuticoccus sediminis TaxID=2184697 RepID=UPI0011B9466B|nr:hypothetical protein [Acuticoccus sediminis]
MAENVDDYRAPTTHTAQCVALWRAVIVQAIKDTKRAANPKRRVSKFPSRDVIEAKDWFIDRSKDYRLVCALANIEEEASLAFLEPYVADRRKEREAAIETMA